MKIAGECPKFELVAGTERKSTGSYYTPPELVRELIKSALEPVIEDRLAQAKTPGEKERALLALKVCDPSSGSGHFMLAAARRLGRELARVRSGEAEPNPTDYRHAIRDVIRCCIYAVDKNPLAVDLCKVALWIEGHEPGLPLSFLDHHVKCGDSLIGVFDFDCLRKGVPDNAYEAATGDNKKVAAKIKKTNKHEKKETLFGGSVENDIAHIADVLSAFADRPEASPDDVHAKQAAYAALKGGEEWNRAKWACDLWTAAFFAPLTENGIAAVPMTGHVWQAARGQQPQGRVAAVTKDLAVERPFFHWPLEFPEVLASGGFDITLGNPPWDVSQVEEVKYFTQRSPAIAALTGDARKRAIESLEQKNPELWKSFQADRHASDASNQFYRGSSRFELSARGKINTYALFSELFTKLTRMGTHDRQRTSIRLGRSGIIVPTGIATDATNSAFFGHLVARNILLSLYDFQTGLGFFDDIGHARYKFCLLTMGEGSKLTVRSISHSF